MRTYFKTLAVLIALAAATQLPAKREPFHWPELGVETSIAFASRGMILNFEADGEDGVWLEDIRHRWYYAKFTGGCQGLTYARGIGYDTRGSNRLDRSGAIVVEGQQCLIETFVTADKPLPKKERLKLSKAQTAAAKDVTAASPAN